MIPGQFGPIKRVLDCLLIAALTRTWRKKNLNFSHVIDTNRREPQMNYKDASTGL